MKNNINISIYAILLIFTTYGMAEDIEVTDVEAKYSNNKSVEAKGKLKQSVNLGFSNTTGNSKLLNINGKYDLAFITVRI